MAQLSRFHGFLGTVLMMLLALVVFGILGRTPFGSGDERTIGRTTNQALDLPGSPLPRDLQADQLRPVPNMFLRLVRSVGAPPLGTPWHYRALGGVVLALLALLVAGLMTALGTGRFTAAVAGFATFATPLGVAAALRIEAFPILLGTVFVMAALSSWQRVLWASTDRRTWPWIAAAMLASTAAAFCHPLTLGHALAVLGLGIAAPSRTRSLRLTASYWAWFLAVSYVLLWDSRAKARPFSIYLAPDLELATGPLKTAILGIPNAALVFTIFALFLALTILRSSAGKCLWVGAILLPSALLPLVSLAPPIDPGRDLAITGHLVAFVPGIAMALAALPSALGFTGRLRSVAEVVLLGCQLASLPNYWDDVQTQSAGAERRQSAFLELATLAPEFPKDAQVFLVSESEIQFRDTFASDVTEAFARSFPGIRHRVFAISHSQLQHPVPGSLLGLDWNSSRDRVFMLDEDGRLTQADERARKLAVPAVLNEASTRTVRYDLRNEWHLHAWTRREGLPAGYEILPWNHRSAGGAIFRLHQRGALLSPVVTRDTFTKLISIRLHGQRLAAEGSHAAPGRIALLDLKGQLLGLAEFTPFPSGVPPETLTVELPLFAPPSDGFRIAIDPAGPGDLLILAFVELVGTK